MHSRFKLARPRLPFIKARAASARASTLKLPPPVESFNWPMSANGMVRPCSSPASDRSWSGSVLFPDCRAC